MLVACSTPKSRLSTSNVVLNFLSHILNKEFDKPLWEYCCIVMLLAMYSHAQHLKVLEKQIIFIIVYMDLEAGEEHVSACYEFCSMFEIVQISSLSPCFCYFMETFALGDQVEGRFLNTAVMVAITNC
jgi:hypothetical protein